jgi:pyruvate ferredoxin oxidoreductase gamma subunit
MIEIRFHGRAGQGMVTAADLVAVSAGFEKKFSQAFPFFGSEKRGPPVTSYCRISSKAITIHEQVRQPHIVIVADATVIGAVDVAAGLRENGLIIVNARDNAGKLALRTPAGAKVQTIDGNEIALKHFGKLITNTVMLGALAKATDVVTLESIKKALGERFPQKVAEENNSVVQECFNLFKGEKISFAKEL